MWKRMTATWLVGLSLVAWPAVSVVAAPIKFDFTFKQGPATAIGFITFESTLFANPGVNNFSLPNPAVLDLQVKVTGAAAGNGTFGIASFDGVFLNTGGSALNLGNELVGQPVVAGPWGTNCNGDFNLFSPVSASSCSGTVETRAGLVKRASKTGSGSR